MTATVILDRARAWERQALTDWLDGYPELMAMCRRYARSDRRLAAILSNEESA